MKFLLTFTFLFFVVITSYCQRKVDVFYNNKKIIVLNENEEDQYENNGYFLYKNTKFWVLETPSGKFYSQLTPNVSSENTWTNSRYKLETFQDDFGNIEYEYIYEYSIYLKGKKRVVETKKPLLRGRYYMKSKSMYVKTLVKEGFFTYNSYWYDYYSLKIYKKVKK